MRAMRFAAPASIERRPLTLAAIDPPVPAADEILVRVSACAICRTDLHVIEGDLPLVRSPLVPGHQVVGRVESIGADARGVRVGDRVGIAWLRRTCGRCRFCVAGRENLCETSEYTGWTADGGYADSAVVPALFTYSIPDGFTDVDAAPLLCAGIIGFRALKLSAVMPGGRLAIYGFGSSAHITAQIARARGVDVYVKTREPARREQALALGATWAGDVDADVPARMDGAIVFAPAGDLVPIALADLDRGGTLALAGIHMSRIPALDYARLFEERVVRTVMANTRADGAELLAEAVRIGIRPTVTTFGLEEANEALARLKRGTIAGTGVLVM